MMMTSSALHRAWVVTAGIRASGLAHLRPGVELVVYFASSTNIHTIYVIRKFTEYVTDKYSSKSFQAWVGWHRDFHNEFASHLQCGAEPEGEAGPQGEADSEADQQGEAVAYHHRDHLPLQLLLHLSLSRSDSLHTLQRLSATGSRP